MAKYESLPIATAPQCFDDPSRWLYYLVLNDIPYILLMFLCMFSCRQVFYVVLIIYSIDSDLLS